MSCNITSIGTVRSDRKGLKILCQKDNNRSVPSTVFYQLNDNSKVTATSYVVKGSKKVNNVVVLTTHPQIYRTTDDDNKQKPAIFKVYDYTKGNLSFLNLRFIYLLYQLLKTQNVQKFRLTPFSTTTFKYGNTTCKG